MAEGQTLAMLFAKETEFSFLEPEFLVCEAFAFQNLVVLSIAHHGT